jgi:hypothetical protein
MPREDTNSRHAAEAKRLTVRAAFGLASGLVRRERFVLCVTARDGVLDEPWPEYAGHGWTAWIAATLSVNDFYPDRELGPCNLHCYREAAGILANYLHVLTMPGTFKTIWLTLEGAGGDLRPPTCRTEITSRPLPAAAVLA